MMPGCRPIFTYKLIFFKVDGPLLNYQKVILLINKITPQFPVDL